MDDLSFRNQSAGQTSQTAWRHHHGIRHARHILDQHALSDDGWYEQDSKGQGHCQLQCGGLRSSLGRSPWRWLRCSTL